MSFSKEVKKEILNNGFKSEKSSLAFLCGLASSSAEYKIQDDNVCDFYFSTDLSFLFETINNLISSRYISDAVTMDENFKIGQTQYYKIEIKKDIAKQLLLDTKILIENNGKLITSENFDYNIIENEDGLKGFTSGVFLGCGTSSIRIDENGRTTTGYHIEFSSKNYSLLHEISNIMAQFDILAKLTKRKNLYVLYVKDAEEVSNVLALMGASDAVLKLQNEIVTRQVRNKVNRQNNCYVSNYSKTLNASFNQLEAIKVLDENVGLYNLPEDIQEVALLRLANTEESLEELLKLTKHPMTKSALNHRFQKILKLAKKIKGNK